jgi:hypothetical protein
MHIPFFQQRNIYLCFSVNYIIKKNYMLRKLFTLATLVTGLAATAQPTTGLVAHWDMNGTPNDVSGNGHDGHANNLTPAAGADGVMGHAWYFNGSNSSITIPPSPAFNVNNYTIVARVNVMGFNTGACHYNTIFMRGKTSGTAGGDWYYLSFTDAPAGYGCTPAIDSTKESFYTSSYSSSTGLGPASLSAYDYSPHVVKNTWYTIVATFNDTTYKVYIDNVLKASATITTPGVPIGTGTDSAYIGLDGMEVATGYPYPFKGNIDEIYLYNRVLADTDVVKFYDSCGSVTAQPVATTVPVGGNAHYTIAASMGGATYQWQQNTGTGFTNLSNTGAYSGVTTNSMTVTGVTAVMNSYTYRCLVSNSSGCADTSAAASLTLDVNDINLEGVIAVYPNPVKNKLSISSSAPMESVSIANLLGQSYYNEAVKTRNLQINVADLPAGVYLIKINGSLVRRFIKE